MPSRRTTWLMYFVFIGGGWLLGKGIVLAKEYRRNHPSSTVAYGYRCGGM